MGNKDLDHLPYKNGRGVGVRGCLPLVWLTPFLPSSLSFSLAKPTHLSLHNEEETDKENWLSLLGIIPFHLFSFPLSLLQQINMKDMKLCTGFSN